MDATVTFTSYRNKITGIAEGVPFFDQDAGEAGRINGVFTRNAVGHPIASYYAYKVVGLYQSADDVAKSPSEQDAAPGRFKYQDTNGDGAITPDDRVFIGNPNPKFSYGLNLDFSYKAFTLTAFFYGVQGKDAINYVKWWTDFFPSFQGAKSKDALYNSWSPTNPNAKIPIQENAGYFSTNGTPNSYYMENASYLRMKNLTLGYKLPADFLKRFKIDRFYIYVQATNLFTITKYKGLDPEIINFDDRVNAFDAGAYPTVREYLVGATVNF
jgi:TonB-dependent starch-binding outer membrane protein SusC